MSKVVDERVVSMQFDNKQFESNVATTMTTLDKLKQKLNLSGASKGLEGINSAVSKCDMSPLGTAVESVKTKFSALEIMGVTALANITNSAVNAGKRIVSALTIDPVKTGLSEYETQINATQTILANTESKGSTIDDVNKALEELNKYADLTIYNFTEMTRNIGTFTAAGVDLETSTNAIKGIANLAAVSGSTSQQASTAMYQLSQALASGTVKLMDWNSVVNAGMGGQVFQDALKETARVHGVAIDELIEKEGSFRETLSSGWLTSEILTDTLEKFTYYAEEGSEAWNEYIKVLKQKGYTEEQAREIIKLGNTATEAATKVKTFTQLFDVMKEAAQSGWSQTWKIIIGDFEEAKALLSPLADFFVNIINKISGFRNDIVESAFGRGFSDIVKNIMKPLEGVADVVETVSDAVGTVTDALKDYDQLVDEIIRGEWGNAPTRWQDLTKAGYDWAYAQNLVNKRLGDSTRHATDYVASQEKAITATNQSTKAINEWTDAEYESLEALIAMNDEQLRSAGYTEEQIAALRELEALAKKLGLSVTDLLKNINEINGRWLIIEGFKNLAKSITIICTEISDAWKSTFTSLTKENIANVLFDGIAAFHRFSTSILEKITTNADKIQRIFKGLFSIIHIATTVISGPLKLVYQLFTAVLGAFNLDILGFIANISDLIVKFHDWFIENNLVMKGIEKLAGLIAKGIKWTQDWLNAFKQLEFVQEFWASFTDTIDRTISKFKVWSSGFRDIFGTFFDTIHSMDEITFDGILDALIQLRDDILEHFDFFPIIFRDLLVPIGEFGKALLKHFCIYDEFEKVKKKVQEVAAAFKEWFKGLREADDPVQYLIDSIKNGLTNLVNTVKEYWSKIWSVLSGAADDSADGIGNSSENIGKNIVLGIVKGIWEGIKTIGLVIKTLCVTLINTAKEMLGIHSPSVIFFAIGGFIVSGLILGLLNSIPSVGEALTKFGSYILENFGSIVSSIFDKIRNLFSKWDFSKISAAFWTISSFLPGLNILNIFAAISNAFSTFGTTIGNGFKNATDKTKEGATKLGNGFSTVFEVVKNVVGGIVTFLRDNFGSIAAIIGGLLLVKAVTKLADVVLALTSVISKISDAISGMFKSFGKAAELVGKGIFILLLAFAIKELANAFVALADLSWSDIGKGAAVIGGLAIVLTGIAVALGFLSKKISPIDTPAIAGMALIMLSLAASIGILAYALTLMDGIDASRMWQNIGAIGVLAVGLAGVAAIMSKVKGEVTKGSLAMIAISAAILILVFALTKLNALVIDDPVKTIGALMAIAAGLALVALTSKGIDKGAALGMIGMVLSIWLFTKLLKSIVKNKDTLKEGYGVILLVMAVFAGIMLATRLMGENKTSMTKIGAGILMLAMALFVVVGAMKMIAKMDSDGLTRALAVVSVVMLMFAVLIASTKFAGEHVMRAGVMLIMMSTALLILAGTLAIITLIAKNNPNELMKATAVVAVMLSLFAMLIYVSKFAQKSMGAVIAIAATIGILVAAVGLFTLLDPKELAYATAALTALMLTLGVLISSLRFIQTAKGTCVKTIATLLILSGIIVLLGLCIKQLTELPDPSKALYAAGALSMVMIAMATALLIMGKAKMVDNTVISTAIIMVGLIVVLSAVLSELQNLDPDKSIKIAGALGGLLLAISGACLILSKSKWIDKSAIKAAIAMGAVLAEIAIVLGLCQLLKVDVAYNNVIALGALLLVISGACLILSKCQYVSQSAIKAAMSMGIVLAEIAVVLGLCQLLRIDAAYNNVISLGSLLLVISGACFILSKCRIVSSTAIKAAMAMGIVLAEIAVVLGLCQLLKVDAAYNNVIALGTLLLVISGACLILSKCTYVSQSAIKAAMAMGVVLAEIAVVLAICQWLKVDAAYNNVIALGALLLVISGACLILSKCKNVSQSAIKAAMAMGVVLAEIAVVLAICQWLKVDAAYNNVIALGALLLAISLSCAILSGVKSVSASAILAVAALGVILLELGGVLALIIKMNIKPCLGIVVTLSALLIALSVVTGILALIGPKAINAIPAAVGLMGVITVIGGVALAIGGLMNLISPETVEKWSVGLQSFMDFIVILATGLGKAIGGLIGGTLGGIGQGLSDFMTNLQGFIEGAKSIDISVAEGMKALGAAILAITAASILDGLSKLFGLGSMDELGDSMASFGNCMIDFAESISTLTEEDITRIKMAAEAGKAMADMESTVPKQGGLWQEIVGASKMADFGTRMVAFGESLVTFAKSIVNLTEDDIAMIKLAAEAGKAMTALEKDVPKQGGLWQEIIGASKMEDFGSRMEAFGGSLVAFSKSIADLTEDDIARIKLTADAGEAMTALENSLSRTGGWWQDIVGEKDIATFGNSMVAFGDALVKYSKKVSSLDKNTATNIENSKAAAEALVGVYDVLPEDEGWLGKIAGETDASAFGTGMYELAKGLTKYATAAAELDKDAAANIKNSKDAIEALKDVATVVNGKGLFNTSVGNTSEIATFGTSMVSLAGSLMEYSSVVSEGIDITSIEDSKTAIIAMTDAAKALPNNGGLAGLIAGENGDITTFGSKMTTFAGQVMTYASKVSAITEDDVAKIGYSKTAIIAMASAAKALPNEGGLAGLLAGENSDITTFGSKMSAFADQLMTYAFKVSGITEKDVTAISYSKDAIVAMADVASKVSLLSAFETAVSDGAINQLEKLIRLIKGMGSVDFSPAGAFADSLSQLGEAGVTQFINAFTKSYNKVSTAGTNMVNALCDGVESASNNVIVAVTLVTGYMLNALDGSVTLFYTSGVTLMKQLASGIGTGNRTVATSVTTALTSAITSIRGQYTSWYNTGTYLVSGFASGITANSFKAAAAASAMAKTALDAAKEKLKINSPSKIFRDVVGAAIPEGFAAGIDKFAYMVTDSTTAMSDTALQGAKAAIAKLADYVDADIDTQPTIRPVLDLSNIASGANAISGMFSMTPSVGVLANVGSISSMMNNQNGTNDDVVSAIDKLRKDLGNIGGTNYNINGVNVNDDAAVVDAIQRIARRANVERRV